MGFKIIYVPVEGMHSIMRGSKIGVIIPKNFFEKLEGEYVKISGLSAIKPFKTSGLDLKGFLLEQIANLCGFANDQEALTFIQNAYQRPELTLNDLMAYYIEA